MTLLNIKKIISKLPYLNKFKLTKKQSFVLKRFFLVLIIVAIVLFVSFKVLLVSMVNGSLVTRFEIIRQLEKEGGAQVLDSKITQKLVFQQAKRNNINISDEEITEEINEIKNIVEEQGSTLAQELLIIGQTEQELRENIKFQKFVEELLKDRIVVTAEEVKQYYEDNADLFEGQKLEDVENQIRDQLTQQKLSQEFQTWILEVRESSKIINFINY